MDRTQPAIASSGLALNASTGYGNYNGGFITLTTQNFHGLLMHNNFTYSKALGTGAFVQATSEYTPNDAFDLSKMYGVQAFNRKFVYNSYMVYQPAVLQGPAGHPRPRGRRMVVCPSLYRGQRRAGLLRHADRWSILWLRRCQQLLHKRAVRLHQQIQRRQFLALQRRRRTDAFGNGVGTATAGSGSRAVNLFKDPVSVWNQVRAPILGIDSKNPGVGPIVGTPYWNVDMSVEKSVKVYESVALKFSVIFTNVFNHDILGDPAMNLTTQPPGACRIADQHSTQDGVRHARQLLNCN